jgi:hypothetical protein
MCSVLSLQKLLNFFSSGSSSSQPAFDVVVYDCDNTEEILRLIGSTDRAKYGFSLLVHNIKSSQDSKSNAHDMQNTGLT